MLPSSFDHAVLTGRRCDLLNRAFSLVGLNSRRALHLSGRAALVIAITWMPMAVFAAAQGLYSTQIDARNFFADYAAYAQFLIALPLFIVAERIVSRATREAGGRLSTPESLAPPI